MGFSLKGAVTGALSGFSAGGPWGAAAGGLAGGLLGGDDDQMTALQAYQMQRADSLSDWNRQNAYNSPVEQMKRLHEAGLNPYLVYSGGNVSGNNSSGINNPSYSASYAQPFSQQLTKALQNLNLRSMKAETKGKEVDTEMRELDLALKKARLSSLMTGHSQNKPMTELQQVLLALREKQLEKENDPDKEFKSGLNAIPYRIAEGLGYGLTSIVNHVRRTNAWRQNEIRRHLLER